MPLDPNDLDARLDGGKHETSWWGVAEQLDDMTYRVTRCAHYNHAYARTEDVDQIQVWILGSCLDDSQPRPHMVAPGTPGARRAATSPLVASGDHGQTWTFAATGWDLPEVIR